VKAKKVKTFMKEGYCLFINVQTFLYLISSVVVFNCDIFALITKNINNLN